MSDYAIRAVDPDFDGVRLFEVSADDEVAARAKFQAAKPDAIIRNIARL